MDILLLNDSRYAAELSKKYRVLSVGPDVAYRMHNQNLFDIFLPEQIEYDLTDVLKQCRAIHADFEPDYIIQFETTLNYFYRGIETSPAKTIWRLVDNHLFSFWQRFYGQLFDLVLIAHQDSLDDFLVSGCNAYWFPISVDTSVHFDRKLKRDLDVSFVGSMHPEMQKERIIFFNALQKQCDVSIFQGKSHEEISEIYNRSKIVINECLRKDVNYRLFESMANGALCLNPKGVTAIDELLTVGVDICTYEAFNPQDAAKKIKELLTAPERCTQIAENGQKTVLLRHTLNIRIAELLDFFPTLTPRENRLNGSLSAQFSILNVLAEFYFGIAKDTSAHLKELCSFLLAQHPQEFSTQMISLALNWFERGFPNATNFFLDQSRRGGGVKPQFIRLRRQLRQLASNMSKN